MEPNGLGIFESGLMAAVTLPLAFYIARLCLNGVLRLIAAANRGR